MTYLQEITKEIEEFYGMRIEPITEETLDDWISEYECDRAFEEYQEDKIHFDSYDDFRKDLLMNNKDYEVISVPSWSW